jgi:hypothetical protein
VSKLFDGVEDLSSNVVEDSTATEAATDNAETSSMQEEEINKVAELQEEEIVLDPETEKFRQELLERAKRAFTDVKEDTFHLYFVPTLKSAKDDFPIENTSLKPNGYTLLAAKRMDEAYYEQLKRVLYSENEKVDEEGLITLLTLYRQIKTKNYPIAVKTHSYRKFTRQFAMGLNYLFNREELMIKNIYILFFSNSSLKEIDDAA